MNIKRILVKALALATHCDLHATRFLVGLTEFSCAVLLLVVGNALEFPSYQIMRDIIPEFAWACLFLSMSFVQFYILFKGDYHTKLAVWFAGINQSIWWFVVLSMIASHAYPPLAFAAYMSIAWASTVLWIRSGHNRVGRRSCDI